MAFVLLSKMVKSKINEIRHTISSMQKRKTIMPEIISQLLNNRLIVPTMRKREDYKRSKHGAVFSPWQILIEPNDWEDFKNGKEGVRSRYRIQNLPHKSCTGIYELGVAVIDQDQGQKLDLDNVLPAYVGKSVNVRSRIQHYGRCGGHFPPGFFEGVFSKGGLIAYRWVPMGLKSEAEAEEGKILRRYDYALNRCSNGERRHLELFKKLFDREFMGKRKSGTLHVLFPFLANQFCIRIKEERKLSCDVDGEKSNHFFTSMLKLIWSRLQVVSDRFDDASCSDSVCGVILEDGGCCNRSPVKGRKRCVEHKWQRVCRVSPEENTPPQPEIFAGQDQDHKDSDVMCGVILPDMKPCNKRPVPGRKRCEDHKGMRINAFFFLLNRRYREKLVKYEKSDTDCNYEEEGSTRFCEATTKIGLPCTRRSPKDSKSCWQHKEKTSGDTSSENFHSMAGKK